MSNPTSPPTPSDSNSNNIFNLKLQDVMLSVDDILYNNMIGECNLGKNGKPVCRFQKDSNTPQPPCPDGYHEMGPDVDMVYTHLNSSKSQKWCMSSSAQHK